MNRPIAFLVASSMYACAGHDLRPALPISNMRTLCPSTPDDGFCMNSRLVTRLMMSDGLEVIQSQSTSQGVSGAKVMVVSAPSENKGRIVFRAKWKTASKGGDSLNNSPRRELAAYQVQQLFLEPDEYVVPPSVGRCLPLTAQSNTANSSPQKPTFSGTTCVFGVISYWVENVTNEQVLDLKRFDTDLRYRETLANLNLLTYLIDHRDSRSANFMISKTPASPRALSVDNGLAFRGFRNPIALFGSDWSKILVPSLPRRKIEKLRNIDREALEKLGTVAQYQIHEGVLEAAPALPPIDKNNGVRVSEDSATIQLGLTQDEIDALQSRIQDLLKRVDEGSVRLFD